MGQIPEPYFTRSLFADTKLAWIWLPFRFYIGWEWLTAGWEKIFNPVWVGPKAGVAVNGFLTKALEKTGGAHPDVQGWYAAFIQNVALPNDVLFSYLVSFGEVAVGLGLILGVLTPLAILFGILMNFNYLLSGTVSTNPVLLLGQIPLLLAWKVAGWYGLDQFIFSPKAPWRSKNRS